MAQLYIILLMEKSIGKSKYFIMIKKFSEWLKKRMLEQTDPADTELSQKATQIIQKTQQAQNSEQIKKAKQELTNLEKQNVIKKATDIRNRALGANVDQQLQMKKQKK